MNCPKCIAEILLKILAWELIQIRAAGWKGDAVRCASGANHVHNIPDLIKEYSPDLLNFYWKVERPQFIKESPGDNLKEYEKFWDQLEAFID